MSSVTAEVQVVKEKVGVSAKSGKPYTVYSILADNQWYNCGFDKPSVNKGDVADITYTTDTYGNKASSVRRSASGASTASSAPAKASGGATMKPVPLNNSRAIIRQNSLSRAMDLYVASKGDKVAITDKAVLEILALAEKFEAYSSGDADIAVAKAAETVARKATLADLPEEAL